MSTKPSIYVVRDEDKPAERTVGFFFNEEEAEKYCSEVPVVENLMYTEVEALNKEGEHNITMWEDKVTIVFEETGYGNFTDIGYTVDRDEAVQYLRDHFEEARKLYTEDIERIKPGKVEDDDDMY